MAKCKINLAFPYNLFAKVKLGELKSQNGELIQELIVKETLLYKILKFLKGELWQRKKK
jgi:hypothetical protein